MVIYTASHRTLRTDGRTHAISRFCSTRSQHTHPYTHIHTSTLTNEARQDAHTVTSICPYTEPASGFNRKCSKFAQG